MTKNRDINTIKKLKKEIPVKEKTDKQKSTAMRIARFKLKLLLGDV